VLCPECASDSRWPCSQIQIWTNHWGYFQLRLCPLSSTSNGAEKAELTEGCLNKHVLPLSGGRGSKYWIYKVSFSLVWVFRLLLLLLLLRLLAGHDNNLRIFAC